jgi:D-xylose transport system permease protein
MAVTNALALLLAAFVPVADLTQAVLYEFADWDDVQVLRFARDGLAVVLAAVGFLSPRLPTSVRLPVTAYGLLVAGYAVVGLLSDEPPGLVASSAAQLLVPVLFLLAGVAATSTRDDFDRMMAVVLTVAVATTAFGLWDVRNTGFWVDQLRYGDFLYDVKRVTVGFHPVEMLPWNFFGFGEDRRAAGLLAAPLAQGSYLAVAGIFGYAVLRGTRPVAAHAFLAVCGLGVLESGTRGAMLMMLVGVALDLFLSSRRVSGFVRNVVLFAVLVAVPAEALIEIGAYTLALEDGSTIGHLEALARNVAEIGTVLIVGDGLGAAGALAADAGLRISGGGEGAIFSIAFQVGVPGALLFLWIGAAVLVLLHRRRSAPSGGLAVAGCAAAVAAASSMVISEHLLTVSGMGTFWLLLGGCLALVAREAPSR